MEDHTLFTRYDAEIMDGEHDDTTVGKMLFIHVNGELLCSHDDPLSALDDYEEQTHRCQPFITEHGTFKRNIVKAINSLGREIDEDDPYNLFVQDFILIDSIRIEPNHRNKVYGTNVINIIKAKFPFTPIVLQPFPIDEPPTNCKPQLRRIKQWYAKRGFVRIQRSEMYVACNVPLV